MIYKTASPTKGYVRVVFELPPFLWADHITVVGDFNNWRADATPLHQDRDGVWRATVELQTGARCEFRYLVDGAWMTDYHADGFVTGAYGAENSVVNATLPETALVVERRRSLVHNGATRPLHRPFHPVHKAA